MTAEQAWHHVRFLLNNELNALYISMVFRALAFSMVGIFVPIYLFIELGYSLQNVIGFFLVYSIIFPLITLSTYKLMDKLSFKYIILVVSPLYVGFFIILEFLKFNPWLFFIAPILIGIADGIYWPNFHFEFSGVSDKKRRGSEVGNFFNFSLLAGLVGPLIGGAIVLFSGFELLFLIVLVLLAGSSVPMFFSKHKNQRTNIKFKNIFVRKQLKDMVAFLGKGGVLIVAGVFWPIFIFTILKGYLKTGSLFTGIALITILYVFLISKLSDKYNRKKLVRIGTIFHAIGWISKVFIVTPFHLVVAFIFRGLSGTTADVPFLALTYDKSKHKAEYFVMREVVISLGRVVLLLLVLWTGSLESSFVLAGLFSLLYMFL